MPENDEVTVTVETDSAPVETPEVDVNVTVVNEPPADDGDETWQNEQDDPLQDAAQAAAEAIIDLSLQEQITNLQNQVNLLTQQLTSMNNPTPETPSILPSTPSEPETEAGAEAENLSANEPPKRSRGLELIGRILF